VASWTLPFFGALLALSMFLAAGLRHPRVAPGSPRSGARAVSRTPLPAAPVLLPRAAARDLPLTSPTGRNPKLLWTPERQQVWERMRRDNDPWYQYLKTNADKSGTPQAKYADFGQWATLMYQITGDAAYADKAWFQITHGNSKASYLGTASVPTNSSNFTREHFIDFVWMYDWLYPWLTADKRQLFIQTLNYWGDTTLAKAPLYVKPDGTRMVWPIRLDDSDNTVGHYFGMAFLDLATGADNPRAGEFLTQPVVGGLVASDGDLKSTFRNAIRKYVEEAEGGEWIESSEYNLGTLRLLFEGAEGVRTAMGRDYFPEITALQREVAQALLQEMTPDLKESYQWGDVQDRRALHARHRLTLGAMLEGLLQDDAPTGPALHQALGEIAASHTDYLGRPDAPFFLFYNPYASQASWRQELPRGHYAPGQGLMLFHNGWREGDTLFGAHMTTHVGVDHENAFFGDFQLYRKGEWAVTHPIGYGLYLGDFTNSMLIGSFSSMDEERGPVAHEFGAGGEYAYLAGTTRGRVYEEDYFNPPPAFLHEWTRSILYLPSRDRQSDSIVVFDRVAADNLKEAGALDRLRPAHRERLKKAPALKQWLLHAPVSPVPTADGVSWTTPGGQRVQLSTLLPADCRHSIVNEDELWPEAYTFPVKGEQKWQVQVLPDKDRPWDTFLNVVHVSDGASLKTTLVRAEGDAAQGALLRRDGSDTLVLFGAKQAARVLDSGYSVSWTSGGATDLDLFDLAPGKGWTASVDGGSPEPLTVSDQGVGRLRVSGSGKHSLRLEK
jgi:hypothetical protein